jgi:hypothetical protein
MPEMALEPDMRGVWRRVGTRLMREKPVNTARTKT